MMKFLTASTLLSPLPCDLVLIELLRVAVTVYWLSASVSSTSSVQIQQQSGSDYPTGPVSHDIVDPVESFCEKSSFEAQCLLDEVIVVTYARYGRMRPNDCISRNYGRIGCSVDVQQVLDSVCSGRRRCQVNVASAMSSVRDPCDSDLRSYLEVSHRCVKVAYADKSTCHSSGAIELRHPSGYLSNLVADEEGCGTIDNPWWLAASPGQRIRLTLLDFGLWMTTGLGQPTAPSWYPPRCQVYAVVKDNAQQRSSTICGGGGAENPSRDQVVYTSTGWLIEVRLKRQQQGSASTAAGGKNAGYFLIHYEAIGCPHPVVPRGGWIQKTETGFSLGCNSSSRQDETKKWNIRCQGTEWIGNTPNCTEETEDVTHGWFSVGPTSVASLALVLCIAVAVGILILAVGLCYLRRVSQANGRRESSTGLAQSPAPRALILRDPKSASVLDNLPGAYDLAGGQYLVDGGCIANDYIHGGGLRDSDRPPNVLLSYQYDVSMMSPSYDPARVAVDDYYDHQQVRYVEHIYDSPKFNRRETGEDEGELGAGSPDDSPDQQHPGEPVPVVESIKDLRNAAY